MTDLHDLTRPVVDGWATLDSGWRAVILGLLVVFAVMAGIPVPW